MTQPGSSDRLENLRIAFRSYKRAASRLRDGHDDLGDAASINFNFQWEEGREVTAAFDEKPPLIRFAALLRPFMDASSTIELREIRSRITAVSSLVSDETRNVMADNFTRVENLGIAVELNGRDLTARDLYFAYAEGQFFDEKPEAKALLDGLSFGPFTQMLPFLFYSACANYAKLLRFTGRSAVCSQLCFIRVGFVMVRNHARLAAWLHRLDARPHLAEHDA